MSAVDELVSEEDDEEPGFLEKLADVEMGIQALTIALSTSTGIATEITALLQDTAARVQNLEKTGGTPTAKLALANRLASLMEDPASRLEVSVGEYGQSILRIEPGMTYLLSRLAAEPDQLAQAPDFPEQAARLIQATEEGIPSTLQVKKSIESIGAATRSLRRVSQRIALTLQSYADFSERIVKWRPLVDGLRKPGNG